MLLSTKNDVAYNNKDIYIGETSRTFEVRFKEHKREFENKSFNSKIVDHA